MGKLIEKLKPKNSTETTRETQAGKFMTSTKFNVEFCLPESGATKIDTWECHVAKSTNIRYDMILGIYLLAALGLDIKYSDNIILGGDGPFKGLLVPTVDISTYDFKPLIDNKVKP